MFSNIFLIILFPSIIYCVYIQPKIPDPKFQGEGQLKELHDRVSAFISKRFNKYIKKFPTLPLFEEKINKRIRNGKLKIKETKLVDDEEFKEILKRKANLINSLSMPELAMINKKEWEQMLKEEPVIADCLFKINIEEQIKKIYSEIHWLIESRRFISTASSDDFIKLKDVTKNLNELQLDKKHLNYLKKVYKRLEKNFEKIKKSVEDESLKEDERINKDLSSGSDQEIKELDKGKF
uniref:Uncharacterized protein n=1 Tax=Meloidogyne hapla TaxID=6305 RepID=A0A1I8BDW1_MELHA